MALDAKRTKLVINFWTIDYFFPQAEAATGGVR